MPTLQPTTNAESDPSVPVRLLTRRRIMLVADEPMSRVLMEAILRGEPDFEMLLSDNPWEMARAMNGSGVDLIALDLAMPAADLLSVCGGIKSHARAAHVPLLLLTPHAGNCAVDRTRAMEAGADDVLAKPFHRSELVLRIRALLRIKALRDEVDEAEQILLALARLIESKVGYAQAHSERVAVYAEMLGREAGLGRDDLRILRRAALLHDVGKVTIPDLILNKPGTLTSEETTVLRQQLLLPTHLSSALANSTPQVLPILRHLHEHVDGSGYPDHLVGREIPFGARLLAIADAFDSMTSQRAYRSAYSHEKAAQQLHSGAGSQWDGSLVKIFLQALSLQQD